jgi:hypothetical protein
LSTLRILQIKEQDRILSPFLFSGRLAVVFSFEGALKRKAYRNAILIMIAWIKFFCINL